MTSTDLETYNTPGGGIDGLGEVEVSDLVTPIMVLNQDNGNFGYVHSLSKERVNTFRGIPLGLIKQRILWPPQPGSAGVGPVCRSWDHDHGYPDVERFSAQMGKVTFKGKRVPDANTVLATAEPGGEPLSCAACPAPEWGTHPMKNNAPYCDEQWTFPVMVFDEDGDMSAVLISFSRSAMKPTKQWVNHYVAAKRPMYTQVTEFGFKVLTQGQNDYAVPTFTLAEKTREDLWPTFSLNFASAHRFATTPRMRRGDDATEAATAPPPSDGNANTARQPVAQTPAAATAAQTTDAVTDTGAHATGRATPAPTPPAPAAPVYDDDEPF